MTPSPVGFVRGTRLPPDPSSPARARAFVIDALRAADREDDADLACLLVSETVTNAVLHAGTDVEVRCKVEGVIVRVEARDGSPVMPSLRHYDDEAMTGRGLAMVDALASAWGVDSHPAGKTVWFELGTAAAGAGATGAPALDPAPPSSPVTVVHLRDLPVRLVKLTVQYGEGLLRELALLSAAEGGADKPAWHSPQFDLRAILDAVDGAEEAGQVTLDIDVEVRVGAGHAALERLARIDEADRMASEGLLLSSPAVPEVGACRRWLFGQVATQEEGGPATPWEMPADLEATWVPGGLSAEQRVELEGLTAATVVADDANRIIFANEAAADLVGWTPEELAGRRLTTVVPPELREAHLVGFTRYLLTGGSHLVGRTVRVPALHHDGSRVLVDLLIEPMQGSAGRSGFRATLSPVPDAGRPSDTDGRGSGRPIDADGRGSGPD